MFTFHVMNPFFESPFWNKRLLFFMALCSLFSFFCSEERMAEREREKEGTVYLCLKEGSFFIHIQTGVVSPPHLVFSPLSFSPSPLLSVHPFSSLCSLRVQRILSPIEWTSLAPFWTEKMKNPYTCVPPFSTHRLF